MLCCGFTNFLLRGVSRDHALRIAVLPAWLQKKRDENLEVHGHQVASASF